MARSRKIAKATLVETEDPRVMARFRLRPTEVEDLDKLRGSIPRSPWFKDAALRYTRRVLAGQDAHPDVVSRTADDFLFNDDEHSFILRFHLTPEEEVSVNQARRGDPVGLWLRAAGLAYIRDQLASVGKTA